MATLDATRAMTDKIDGFLTGREGLLLHALAKNCPAGNIVEIGSWKGKSTVWLASGARRSGGKRIFAIDPHTGSSEHQKDNERVWTFEEFEANIRAAECADLVEPLVKTSADARKGFQDPVALLFIDGAHEYEWVKLDYELWSPLVVPGGYIAFHDSHLPGVRAVIHERLRRDGFTDVYFSDNIVCARKTGRTGAVDGWKARVMLNLKDRFETARTAAWPKPVRSLYKNLINFGRLLLKPSGRYDA